MNNHKQQAIEKIVREQAGQERLVLNDLVIGYEEAGLLSHLIPQYHLNLVHIQLKGNNIDSEGFEMLFAALLHCPQLVSLMLEWNSLGSSEQGLKALCLLASNLLRLQIIDLKNNRLTHQHAQYLAELIKNALSLKAIDLRWNQLGEIGAKIILEALQRNSKVKYVGLQDNRIPLHVLRMIEEVMTNPQRAQFRSGHSNNLGLKPVIFPLSEDAYPSMQQQLKTGQLRIKIQNQQQEAQGQIERLQVEINKAVLKFRVYGTQMHQLQLRLDGLNNQNTHVLSRLREAERKLALEQERYFGIEKGLTAQREAVRTEKYNLGLRMRSAMEKGVLRSQRQLQELQAHMGQKLVQLQHYLRERLNEKRRARENLADIKEDILKFRQAKEAIWDRASTAATGNKAIWEDNCHKLQEQIARAESSLKAEQKKSSYLMEELSGMVVRGLAREEKYEGDIFQVQNGIKQLHKQMTMANVDIEEQQLRVALLDCRIAGKETNTELLRRYSRYVQSLSTITQDIERMRMEEELKGVRLIEINEGMRIEDSERVLRGQITQNKLLRNQIEQLVGHVQAASRLTIQQVLTKGG